MVYSLEIHCGSGLAREGGPTGTNENGTFRCRFASRGLAVYLRAASHDFSSSA
ncbi:hypothetical protein ABH909_004412 [Pseudomonas sp. BS3782 TE3695]|jgi:hypothetical protein